MPTTWLKRTLAHIFGAGCVAIAIFNGAIVLVGNILKLRAQYVPKTLTGESITSTYWGIIRRTYGLEGIQGLLRGIVPLFLPALVLACFTYLTGKIGLSLPAESISVTLLWILACPIGILVIRTLTTPEPLPSFDIHPALHQLLTPEERARPWLLYLVPGVLTVMLIQTTWNKLILAWLRKKIVSLIPDRDLGCRINTLVLLQLAFVLLDTVVLLPLETLTVRLSLMDVGSMAAPTTGEQVLSLRTGLPPYTGVWNCILSIINEEGFGAFHRAWWLSLLMRLPGMPVSYDVLESEKNQEGV